MTARIRRRPPQAQASTSKAKTRLRRSAQSSHRSFRTHASGRLFRTFKEMAFQDLWMFTSGRQLDRRSANFVQFYNCDRPHFAWDGRTPNEVYFRRRAKRMSTGRVTYFDGHLCWYKFG
jgi:transposase InsO family protein